MSSDPIEIALPSDQTYFPGLLVTVFSIAKSARQNAELSFNILDGGIADDSFAVLQRAVAKVHPNTSFRRFKIAEQEFSSFPAWKGNRMTYVRYLLPELLPDSHFVVYADSDCLWLEDVANVWARRDENVILQAVYDASGEQQERPWFESRGLSFSGNKYFCNGLLLVNLNRFRFEKIVDQAICFCQMHPDIMFADQSAFNHVVGERVVLMPRHLNVFTRDLSRGSIRCPIILHYAGDLPWKAKAWISVYQPPYMAKWFETFAAAANIDMEEACAKFGCHYRKWLNSLLTYALPRKWPRRLVLGILLLMGRHSLIKNLKRASVRCGRIYKQ